MGHEVTWLRGSELGDPRHRSLVLEVATRVIFPLIMVLSAYFLFTGHNTPGGGFAGGLTAGLALVLVGTMVTNGTLDSLLGRIFAPMTRNAAEREPLASGERGER